MSTSIQTRYSSHPEDFRSYTTQEIREKYLLEHIFVADQIIGVYTMKVIDVDLVSPFILSQRVAKTRVENQGGKIINICSMMSELGRNTVSAYAAAKGGLKMLTRNLATEWAQYNIQVNGIGPGYFATDQTAPIRVDGHPFNDFIIPQYALENLFQL